MTKTTVPALFKNFPSFGARSVGFDDLFDALDRFTAMDAPTYPPYNITKTGEADYQITVAAAGFKKHEIVIEQSKEELHIKAVMGKVDGDKDIAYIHRGLALRDFSLKFKIANNVEVTEVTFDGGLLVVNLKHVVMEELKVKQIPIM
jgi:molecular chaperone IbpA